MKKPYKKSNQRSNQVSKKPRGRGGSSASSPSPRQRGKAQVFPGRPVVGLHSCREVLRVRPKEVVEVWVRSLEAPSQDLIEFIQFAETYEIPLIEKSPGVLDRVCASHQGVCLFVTGLPRWDWESLSSEPAEGQHTLMMLDRITDPHNLGAIMRTAWLMGVEALIIPARRSAPLTAASTKVACGAAEHVPLVEESQELQRLKFLKDRGFWIYALDGEGPSSLWNLKLPEKVLWIVGSEGQGIRSSLLKECDERVFLPQIEAQASYNASVAAAVALAETCRQREVRKLERRDDVLS